MTCQLIAREDVRLHSALVVAVGEMERVTFGGYEITQSDVRQRWASTKSQWPRFHGGDQLPLPEGENRRFEPDPGSDASVMAMPEVGVYGSMRVVA